jgi:hypothetical protein
MAKQRLFPKTPDDDKREPHEKFTALASKIVAVPKAEIDQRAQRWQSTKRKSRSKPRVGA